MCAYHGSMICVQYCLKRGADLFAHGTLRSGQCLTAEHWAAVEGYQDVYRYLRAMRIRKEKQLVSSLVSSTGGKAASESSTSNNSQLLDSINNDSTTSSLNSFCICGKGFVGQMIACEASECLVEWYHFECVGLTVEPEGDWICPACRGERFGQPIHIKIASPSKRPRKSGGYTNSDTGNGNVILSDSNSNVQSDKIDSD